MKNTGINLYKPIPIREFCHVECPTASYKQSLPNSLSPDLQEEVFQKLLQGIYCHSSITFYKYTNLFYYCLIHFYLVLKFFFKILQGHTKKVYINNSNSTNNWNKKI